MRDEQSKQLTDEEVRATVIRSMAEAEFPPAVIYAFRKTGVYLCEENESRWSEVQLAAWNSAINEYNRALIVSH